MLYLKNTLGGLTRTLTDSALHSFQGPHRWWKLALYAVLFVLPGGSIGVIALAWIEHRRARPTAPAEKSDQPVIAQTRPIPTPAAPTPTAGTCRSHLGAPCRAAAGKSKHDPRRNNA